MTTGATTKIAALEAACRAEGLPLTVQRRTILEVLARRTDHPTADQVFAVVRKRLPDVSRTTVYRVLDTLVRLGLAVKTPHPGASVRFDPRTERHHHLVCRDCDRVIDLHAPELNALRLPDTRGLGFEIDDFSLHIRGRCAACK
jgi:Fur family peroxide stress response transcriptional regulator